MRKTFRDHYVPVKSELDAAFKSILTTLLESSDVKDIETLASILCAGKKIRGCLLCLVSLSLDGALDEALPMALAVELVQAASLIHDDFVDQDIIRRNRPAVWTLEGSRRAVLLGDVLFSTAIKNMSDQGNEPCRAISEAILKIACGAFREPIIPETLREDIVSGRFHPEVYETIIGLKSGTLFGTACKLGAIAATADKNTQEIFRRYGAKVGEAYQIADDLHDIEQCIAEPSVPPDRVTLLTPILLYFAKEMRPQVMAAMGVKSTAPIEELVHALNRAARQMREEIGKRLRYAQSLLRELTIKPPHREVLENAPEELLSIFNASAFNPRP
jgi:hypothetical protein